MLETQYTTTMDVDLTCDLVCADTMTTSSISADKEQQTRDGNARY